MVFFWFGFILGKNAEDDVKLGALEMKPNYKLMMVGSLEEDIKNVANKPFDTTDVLDDFEDIEHDSHIPLQKLQVGIKRWRGREVRDSINYLNYLFLHFQIYLAKVNKRVRDYNISELNPPRENKRLLVLDIDYTLFDHRSTAETGEIHGFFFFYYRRIMA